MLLTTELDKLSGTDWQLFFAQERAKPYFAELDAFVTAAAAEKTVYLKDFLAPGAAGVIISHFLLLCFKIAKIS